MYPIKDSIESLFLKKALAMCLKELLRIIRTVMIALRRMVLQKRGDWYRKYLPHILTSLAITGCVILLLVTSERKVYEPSSPAPSSNEITLTLDNGKVIPIQTLPATGAAYVYVNADSILYAIKNTTGIDYEGMTVLNVPAGRPPVLTRLPDGTLVHVNVASRLSFPARFTEHREVKLDGEAYFEVARNLQQPFIIQTTGFEVQALSTKFNISNYRDDDKAQISLLEGDALLHIRNMEKNIQPGETLILNHKSGQSSLTPFDKRSIGWRNGIYFFDGESLAIVCKNASRLYGATILIENKRVANLHFSGAINRKQPLEVFLNYIKDTGNVDYYIDNKERVHFH